ncbi:hypothetical protein D3C85_1781790 [compost metagenome]
MTTSVVAFATTFAGGALFAGGLGIVISNVVYIPPGPTALTVVVISFSVGLITVTNASPLASVMTVSG